MCDITWNVNKSSAHYDFFLTWLNVKMGTCGSGKYSVSVDVGWCGQS